MFVYQIRLKIPELTYINFSCSILKLEQNHVRLHTYEHMFLRVHLDHQALSTADFFSFQPYFRNINSVSLHSSNKVSYMSDAGAVVDTADLCYT
jgi:hypothetical protein